MYESIVDLEAFGKSIVIEISLQRRVEIAEPQYADPLIDLTFKRR
jgi:hypothetical protein